MSLAQAQEGASPEPAPPIEEATPDEPPGDPDKTYRELVQLAQEDFEAKRYDDALTALDQAYRLKPNPNLIYNRARILEAKGDMPGALREYEAFAVAPDVDLEYRRETLERIRVLKEVIALKEKPEKSGEGDAQASSAAPQPAIQQPVEVPADQGPRPMRRVGAVMMGVGGATLLVGAGFGYLALDEQNELDNSTDLERRRELADNVERLGRNADLLYIGGGALTVIGLGLFIAGRRPRASSSSLRLIPAVSTTQAGMQMSLIF